MLHVEKMSFDLGERLGLRTMYLHHLPTMLPTELTFSHVACSMTSFRFQFSRIVKGSRVLTTELLRKMIDSCVPCCDLWRLWLSKNTDSTSVLASLRHFED